MRYSQRHNGGRRTPQRHAAAAPPSLAGTAGDDHASMLLDKSEFVPAEQSVIGTPEERETTRSNSSDDITTTQDRLHTVGGQAEEADELRSWDLSFEGHPVDRTLRSAALTEERDLMERLAIAAMQAESPAIAARLMAAAAPSALRLVPQVQRALWPVLPTLIRSTAEATRLLHRQGETRGAIRSLPDALERVAMQLARRVAQGKHAHPELVTRLLSQQIDLIVQRQQSARHHGATE